MSEPLLPGIRIGAGRDNEDRPVVRLDLTAKLNDAELTAAVVLPPRGARALAALLLKQADLVEGRVGPPRLHVVGGAGDG